MVSARIYSTQPPPLVELGQLAQQQDDCISLGQGAPYYSPPRWIMEQLTESLQLANIHRYTSDPGIITLRRDLSNKLVKDQQITASPEDIIITPGANQAFFNILPTIADPADEIILLTPYYFNHQMACNLLNITAVTVPLDPDFSLNIAAIEEHITEKTRAIVLVNPGNPTGKVHTSEEIRSLLELATNHDLYIIADETYEYFTYQGSSHTAVGSLSSEQVISIGSFSKTYGIPGWRLGYYTGPEDVIQQSIKVQDTIGICAPHSSQILGSILLKHRTELIPEVVGQMENNHRLALDLLDEVDWLERTPSSGAYYLFPRQHTGKSTMYLVRELIQKYGVYIVPGEGFGSQWEDYCRISFANVEEDNLHDAFSRLKSYS